MLTTPEADQLPRELRVKQTNLWRGGPTICCLLASGCAFFRCRYLSLALSPGPTWSRNDLGESNFRLNCGLASVKKEKKTGTGECLLSLGRSEHPTTEQTSATYVSVCCYSNASCCFWSPPFLIQFEWSSSGRTLARRRTWLTTGQINHYHFRLFCSKL